METNSFINEKMFDLVMEDREIREHILQILFPDKNFKLTEDKTYNKTNPIQSVIDADGKQYDVCMQPTTEQVSDLGRQVLHYQVLLDSDALQANNYTLLKDSIILIFCNNNTISNSYNVFQQQDKEDPAVILNTGSETIIINGSGKANKNSSNEFLDLLRLICNEPVEDDPILKKAEQIIKDNSEN